MTAYTQHADAIFEPLKPNIGATHQQARDNLIAVLEGDDTAPKATLKMIERLTAGTSIRSSVSSALADASTKILVVGFIQSGTVRATVTRLAGAGSTSLTRLRNGVGTTLVAVTVGNLSADISVIPGDVLELTAVGDGSARAFSASIGTGGENLWPSSGANVVGNNV